MLIPEVPPHVRERLIRILADGLRREHPDAVVTWIDLCDRCAEHGAVEGCTTCEEHIP